MMRRKYSKYYKLAANTPAALSFTIKRRAALSEADVMGIVWYGRYALYFENAYQELGRRCGLAYPDFYTANLRAPIVEFHVDYHQSLYLDEEFTVTASFPWIEGAKLLTEYKIKKMNGQLVTNAYTLQMFIDSKTNELCIVAPELLARMRQRWQAGEFTWLK
jgi:acyl-CoA thioester hydrolase